MGLNTPSDFGTSGSTTGVEEEGIMGVAAAGVATPGVERAGAGAGVTTAGAGAGVTTEGAGVGVVVTAAGAGEADARGGGVLIAGEEDDEATGGERDALGVTGGVKRGCDVRTGKIPSDRGTTGSGGGVQPLPLLLLFPWLLSLPLLLPSRMLLPPFLVGLLPLLLVSLLLLLLLLGLLLLLTVLLPA